MFYKYSSDHGQQPWELLPVAEGTYKAGQALTVTGGKLAALSTASKVTPGYICMADITAAEGEQVPVIRVQSSDIYETTLTAETATAAIGAKLEVSAGGLGVDGTAAGTFELVYAEGTAADSVVRGRFL